jgi:hypothetical protein
VTKDVYKYGSKRMECDVAMIWSFWDNSEIKKTKMDEKEAKKIEQNSIKKLDRCQKKNKFCSI